MKFDIDEAALEVARQFTAEEDVQKRAQLQVAVANAITKSNVADSLLLIAAGAEIMSLRRRLAAREAVAQDQQRTVWSVVRAAGGEVTIPLEHLAMTNWERASMKTHRLPGGEWLLTAVLAPEPEAQDGGQ